jgi:hypothetical protein
MKDKRILHLERDPDIFITLKPGWQYDGAHCFGEDTMKDAKETMKMVEPCRCQQCQKELAPL